MHPIPPAEAIPPPAAPPVPLAHAGLASDDPRGGPMATLTIELPDSAFGPCFHRVSRDEDVLEIGFDRRSLSTFHYLAIAVHG